MLRITAYDGSQNYRTLTHSDRVFHKALRAVLNGEKKFHVRGASEEYDLVYEDNNDLYFAGTNLSRNSLFAGETVIPPYFQYDEKTSPDFTLNCWTAMRILCLKKPMSIRSPWPGFC